MSDIDALRAKLAESDRLLAFAEDIILGYQSGLVPVAREAEGVWGQEGDRVDLRRVLLAAQDGLGEGQEVEGGGSSARRKKIWIETSSPSFRSRIALWTDPLLPPFLPLPTPPLPAELLREIISLADISSFPCLCLVHSTFREIASPLLYRRPARPWTPPRMLTFFRPSVTPRLSALRTSLTLDRVSRLSLTIDPDARDISPFPVHHFPNVQIIHLSFNDEQHLINLLSSAQLLLSTLRPREVTLEQQPGQHLQAVVQVPLTLWASATAGWLELERLRFRRLEMLTVRDDALPVPILYRRVPWSVPMPSGRAPKVVLDLTGPGTVEEMQAFLDRSDLDSVLWCGGVGSRSFIYDLGDPPPRTGGIVLEVSTPELKARFEITREGIDRAEHREIVRVVVRAEDQVA